LLEEALYCFIAQHKLSLGMVSQEVPLISNLDVWINIALIKQYHQNLPKDEAKREIFGYLKRFDLEGIATKRNPALSDEERFRVMLLRAAMVDDAVLVIDRPFKLLPERRDSRFIYESIAVIEDLFKECHMFDYVWFKDRYRVSDAS
jgi:ABC-type nitrate/sulfonate/bicarbonate transport system ATPase subunit